MSPAQSPDDVPEKQLILEYIGIDGAVWQTITEWWRGAAPSDMEGISDTFVATGELNGFVVTQHIIRCEDGLVLYPGPVSASSSDV